MLKDSEISRYSTRRTHRTYAREFKSELVAACQVPGASIAALARQHGMNANVLHRWLKEHQRSGYHALAARSAPGGATLSPTFIPLTLPAPTPVSREQEIKVELRKGVLSMVVTWPASAAAEFASWTAAIIK
jgi:transposase-like protein